MCYLSFHKDGVVSMDPVEVEEQLIMYQEQLPSEVLASHDLEEDTMRVLTPAEMIQVSEIERELFVSTSFWRALK